MSTADRKSIKADVRPVLGPAIERLDSWKEIAVYLGREVRTAQRWERLEGLPVHRHSHAKGSSVWAFKHQIDAWLHSRDRAASEAAPKEECLESAAESLNSRRGHLTAGFLSGCRPFAGATRPAAPSLRSSHLVP
jgi:hypothetical protein